MLGSRETPRHKLAPETCVSPKTRARNIRAQTRARNRAGLRVRGCPTFCGLGLVASCKTGLTAGGGGSLYVRQCRSSNDTNGKPPWRQPRGKWMVSLVNTRTNATRIGWHLWEIDLRFAPGLPPGRGGVAAAPVKSRHASPVSRPRPSRSHVYRQEYLAHKKPPLPLGPP